MARWRGRGRGLGRGRVVEERVDESHASQVESVGVSGMRAGVAGVPAGAAGIPAGIAAGAAGFAAGVQAPNDRLADLLTALLEQLPERVPAQAPVVPPVVVAEVRPQGAAAVAEELPSYLRMVEQMQRLTTGFFSGGANPEDADAWLRRMERNILSSRCPAGYRVDIAVHLLEGDAHFWWSSVAARRAQAGMVWADFVEEFYSMFGPPEGLEDRVVECTPSFQAKGVQQQAGPSRGGKPMQEQKRVARWASAPSGSGGLVFWIMLSPRRRFS
ncbi:hypothetical protein V5N11_027822 [Cardamine amara subsp. amara]|uniref:Retrotransposon gag domain-containing protein n=1 Tax=Cardamine amara subsp. amara TaxID=228776 RepID=A0ABD0ZY58_CARAN